MTKSVLQGGLGSSGMGGHGVVHKIVLRRKPTLPKMKDFSFHLKIFACVVDLQRKN